MTYYVYLLVSKKHGTLYIGVTSDLTRRAFEHRSGTASKFSRRYFLNRLVYAEHHEDIRYAIQRETSLKRWPRAWKIDLIVGMNPEWKNLDA